jgi:hypothetical protein
MIEINRSIARIFAIDDQSIDQTNLSGSRSKGVDQIDPDCGDT